MFAQLEDKIREKEANDNQQAEILFMKESNKSTASCRKWKHRNRYICWQQGNDLL